MGYSDNLLWEEKSVGQAARRISTVWLTPLTGLTPTAYRPSDLEGAFSAGCPAGIPHLGQGFALRCFQRLSSPDMATQRCPWQDNWYTRGLSTLVLSY